MRDPRGGDPFRDERAYGGDVGRRRGRSGSPEFGRFGRRDSPPPRDYKRPRRDDRFDRAGSPGSYRPGPPPRSPPRRSDDRRGQRGERRMLTFKEFLMDQADDPGPEEAHARYAAYQVSFHGGEIKAEFVQRKDDDQLRNMFDPRAFERMLKKRNSDASESATAFASQLSGGSLDPSAPGFNQGAFDLAPQLPDAPAETGGGAAMDVSMGDGEVKAAGTDTEPDLKGGQDKAAEGNGTAGEAGDEAGGEGAATDGDAVAPGDPSKPAEATGAVGEQAGAAAAKGADGADSSAPPARPKGGGPGRDDRGGRGSSGRVAAPAVCWTAERVAHDLQLARRLTRLLDKEKGLEPCRLLPELSAPAAAEAANGDGAGGTAGENAAKAGGAGAEPATGDGSDAAEMETTAGAAAVDKGSAGEDDKVAGADAMAIDVAAANASGDAHATAPVSEEPLPVVDSSNIDTCLGDLDLLLTYLWRVHGVDYYAGYELTAHEFAQRNNVCRILRGVQPAADVPLEPAEASRQLSLVTKTVDEPLSARLRGGDPLEARCERRRIEAAVDAWVEDQVEKHAENKWGNKLSTKMFMAKKFVLKHVRTKHVEKLNAEKDRICDDIFFENFRKFKEEAARSAQEGGHGRSRGSRGGNRGAGARFSPAMPMRGPPPHGGPRGGPMDVPPPPMMMPLPGPMLPVAMGGMGGPMVLMPAGAAPMMAPMMPGMRGPGRGPPIGGRGGGGGMGRGGGRGGRGGGGMREYYDLDNPQNNRAVLDYGDL